MAMAPVDLLLSAPPAHTATIALSEGSDPRVVAGALAAQRAGVADIILVGAGDQVRAELAAQNGREVSAIAVHDPATSDLLPGFARTYHNLRRHRGMDEAKALSAVKSPLVYAALLVREGHATGTVGGAVATTSDVVRTAIQVIGTAPQAGMVSSFFLMYPPVTAPGTARAMVYSDSGLVIDPTAKELADIAATSAASCRALLREEPKIALLSFSTKGSATHGHVSKITDALRLVQTGHPDLSVDGELQFDAAFDPAVAAIKAPESNVAGQANVMIFPDLDAGNIGYKITQRLGGYSAIGPVLQGLAQPANDLSRGCVAEDVTQMIAVTVLQSLNAR